MSVLEDPSLVRFIGGRKFALCAVFLLCLFALACFKIVTGEQFLTGGMAAIGANSGGNLLQEWWQRAKEKATSQ